jgi:hypothetical protein
MCALTLMCLRFATMVKIMMTSKDHELHLPMCTADHALSWFGDFHTSKEVRMVSASQMKKPNKHK